MTGAEPVGIVAAELAAVKVPPSCVPATIQSQR